MKTIGISMAASASAALIVYCVGAFGAWDINPGNWNEVARWLTGAIGAVFAVVAGGVASEKL